MFDSPYYATASAVSIRAFDATTYAYLGGVALGGVNPFCPAFVRIGSVMYAIGSNNDTAIFRVTAASINAPGSMLRYDTAVADATGLAVVGTQLWAALVSSELLIRLDPTTMTLLDSIDVSGIGGPAALTSDGTDLYAVMRAAGRLIRITTAGSVTWNVAIQPWANDVLVVAGAVWVLGTTELAVYDADDGAELHTWPVTGDLNGTGIITSSVTPADRIRFDGTHVIVAAREAGVMGYLKFDPASFAQVFAAYPGRYWAGVNGSDVLLTQSPPTVASPQTTAYEPADLDGSLRVDIYQLSASVGRGYVGSKTA